MDGLLAEISLKRKELHDEPSGPTKYMRRADMERVKEEEEERRKKEEAIAFKAESKATKMRKEVRTEPELTNYSFECIEYTLIM